MYPLNRFLVCLDLTPIDQTVMEYTASMTKEIPGSKVYFVHVSKKLEIPEEIKKSFPNITGPADEAIAAGIEEQAEEFFRKNCNTPYEIVVTDGNATEQILKWSQVKEIDVIVMGLKRSLKGAGTNASKITSICHASVLFVPEKSAFQLKRILVPTDFSKNSFMALEQAFVLKSTYQSEVILQNVYRVPVGYHYTGKEYVEFAILMKHTAEKQMAVFLKKHNVNREEVKQLMTLDEDDKPADIIFNEAQAQDVDIIVLGSKGRTMAASLLMGSVAVDLLRLNKEVPYMIIKDKKSNMDFLQAFRKL